MPLVFVPRPQTGRILPVEDEWINVVPAADGEASFAALLGTGDILRRARKWRRGDHRPPLAGRVLHFST